MKARERRDDLIRVRLTRVEWLAIRRTAAAKRLTVSSFLRACAENFLLENCHE